LLHPIFVRRASLALAVALAAPASAETVVDQQIWVNATVMGTIGPRLAFFVEVQPRTADGADRLGALLLRSAAGWKYSDALTLYGGYARIVSPVRHGADRHENRIFTQASWTIGKIGAGTLSSRTRIEHRQLLGSEGTGWRVRDMIRYVHPITTPEAPRALVWAEPFVAFNDTAWGARKGFDQLRSFAGVEVPIKGKSTVELGYLNHLVNDPAGRRRMNHVASLTLFWRL
jgi:hypothetical protein